MAPLIDNWLDIPSPPGDILAQIGVSWSATHKVGGVRWAGVQFRRSGRFEFDNNGDPALLIPAWIDPPSIWRNVDEPILEDIVAVDPAHPRRCATLHGDAAMLGEAALEEARWSNLPLPVFRDPVSWLQAAGAGAVPLDARRFVNAILGPPAVSLVCSDIDHGEAVDRMIDDALRGDRPNVLVAA
jgi:hypothetical protein